MNDIEVRKILEIVDSVCSSFDGKNRRVRSYKIDGQNLIFDAYVYDDWHLDSYDRIVISKDDIGKTIGDCSYLPRLVRSQLHSRKTHHGK